MPTPEIYRLADLLQQLQASARQRPDLLSANQGGPSFGSPNYRAPGDQTAYTFAGRLGKPGETTPQILGRAPIGELEGGGQALGALPQLLTLATVLPARTAKESMIQDLMKKAGLYAKAEADPRNFRTVARQLEDALGMYNPATQEIIVDPRVLAGKIPGAYKPTALEVVGHETLHGLNAPRVAATSPAHALETAQQLATLLQNTQAAPFLQQYVERAATGNFASKTAKLLGSQLSNREKAILEGVLPRRALDESLSYLGQEGLRTSDPLLKALAAAFEPR